MFGVFKGLTLRWSVQIFVILAISVLLITGTLVAVNGTARDFLGFSWRIDSATISLLIIIGVLVSAATSLFLGYWLSRRLVRDLDDVRIGIRILSQGNLKYRWSLRGSREVVDLQNQLNKMAERWEKQVGLLQSLAEEKEQLAEKAKETGIIAERQRLARELHDAVSQQLFALSMTATAAVRLFDKDPERTKKHLTSLESISQKALGEMRALLLHLRPIELENEDLGAAISGILDELEQKGMLSCHCEVDHDIRLSRSVETNLLRIVQEAVANTLRHAQARNLRIKLTAGDTIRLSIEDDGVGFDLEQVNSRKVSYGMQTMKERAEECGGSLNCISVPGKGTRIDVTVPIISKAQEGGEKK